MEHAAMLGAGWKSGTAAYGNLGLAYDAYARGVLERCRARLARTAAGSSTDAIARVLPASNLGDLYLALGCESGIEAAWSTLTREVMPKLKAFVRSRGDAEPEAEDLVSDFAGYLALPPPGGGAKTRMGTYEGAATLFGWLAVLVLRRRVDRERTRHRIVSLSDAARSHGERAAGLDRSARGPDPPSTLASVERTGRLREAIASAFSRMSRRETLAMRLKYADGLQQREIAKLFAVGEARVSVLLKNATAKLRADLTPALKDEWPADGPEDPIVWTNLRDALGTQLATSTTPPDLPGKTHG